MAGAISLMATGAWRLRCSARQTDPIPPRPSRVVSRYFPSRTAPSKYMSSPSTAKQPSRHPRGGQSLAPCDRRINEQVAEEAAPEEAVAEPAESGPQPEIDPDRIALEGHSEGGLIAPIVAATDTLLKGWAHFQAQGMVYPVSIGVWFVLMVIAALTRSQRYHAAYSIFFFSSTCWSSSASI